MLLSIANHWICDNWQHWFDSDSENNKHTSGNRDYRIHVNSRHLYFPTLQCPWLQWMAAICLVTVHWWAITSIWQTRTTARCTQSHKRVSFSIHIQPALMMIGFFLQIHSRSYFSNYSSLVELIAQFASIYRKFVGQCRTFSVSTCSF